MNKNVLISINPGDVEMLEDHSEAGCGVRTGLIVSRWKGRRWK
jgi:hypothetical protein